MIARFLDLEQHFKNRNNQSKRKKRQKSSENIEKYIQREKFLIGRHESPQYDE